MCSTKMHTTKVKTMTHQTNDVAAARIYGFAFIITFLAYGIGTAMFESMFIAADPISALQIGRMSFISSIILTVIVHTLANICLAVIMYKILQPFFRFLPVAYLVLAVIATTALMVGGALLAVALPLSENQVLDAAQAITWIGLLHKSNFYLYQAGMTIWGIGGILMCIALLRTKLVPTVFPLIGFVGYGIFIVGTVSEFYGSGIGVMLSLPGGLFEIGLSIWLIIKGFDYRHVNHQNAA